MPSIKYELLKDYYKKGYWSKSMLKNAVLKAWITSDEYELITQEKYES